jgi:alanine-synthesizing transaminase
LGPGDSVIAPTPSYPIHLWGGRLAGADVIEVPIGQGMIYSENVRQKIKNGGGMVQARLKSIIACFPHNPTGITAKDGELQDLLSTAEENDLFFIHDLAYADIDFGRDMAPSALALPRALDRTVEYFSLSKSYNMPGFRCGFCCGNRDMIAALSKLKSYIDYGMFNPIQEAAIVALDECHDFPKKLKALYHSRAIILSTEMKKVGWNVEVPEGTMFTWAKIPSYWNSHGGSKAFSRALFEATGIAVSAGSGFAASPNFPDGNTGAEYVRFALIENEDRIREACNLSRSFLEN